MRLQTTHSELTCMGWFRRPVCPRCGDGMFAAADTKLVGDGLILYTWNCDSCDHEFRTAVEFTPHGD